MTTNTNPVPMSNDAPITIPPLESIKSILTINQRPMNRATIERIKNSKLFDLIELLIPAPLSLISVMSVILLLKQIKQFFIGAFCC
jgi:hypothetical protein